jgi:hypothetical protein
VKHLRKAGKGIEKRETEEKIDQRKTKVRERKQRYKDKNEISESNKKENYKLESSLPY